MRALTLALLTKACSGYPRLYQERVTSAIYKRAPTRPIASTCETGVMSRMMYLQEHSREPGQCQHLTLLITNCLLCCNVVKVTASPALQS
jgi:hypothetical protein